MTLQAQLGTVGRGSRPWHLLRPYRPRQHLHRDRAARLCGRHPPSASGFDMEGAKHDGPVVGARDDRGRPAPVPCVRPRAWTRILDLHGSAAELPAFTRATMWNCSVRAVARITPRRPRTIGVVPPTPSATRSSPACQRIPRFLCDMPRTCCPRGPRQARPGSIL